MATLLTGPIENRPAGGIRPTQQVTVNFVNQDSVDSSTVLVQGYYLNGIRTLYVLEEVFLTPNEVATRNYFANFDAFEFVFTTSGPAEESTEISVWGKNASGQLVTAHRLVSEELLGSEMSGPQGPQGVQGPGAIESAFRANKVVTEPYTDSSLVIVAFTNELFDFGNEYNGTATFSPSQEGVYQIDSNALFQPLGPPGNEYTIELSLLVNGNIVATHRKDTNDITSVVVSTIYGLNPGDVVNVRFFASTDGNITFFSGTPSTSTYFAAARFPFVSPVL